MANLAAVITTEVTTSPLLNTQAIRIARELAMDIRPLDKILDAHGVNFDEWERISHSEHFKKILLDEITSWNSAANTHERVKLKAAAAVEEWLPELFAKMHDPDETLNAKIEGGKLMAKLAEMGMTNGNVSGGSEKFSVTINMGADKQLKFEQNIPTKVIEHEE